MSPRHATASSTHQRTGALLVGAALIAGAACGETVDLADVATTTPSGVVAGVEAPTPIDDPLPDGDDTVAVLEAMLRTWLGLGDRVIERERADDARDRIVELWRIAEPTVRAERPELLFGFQQAVDLAVSSVDRRRPADASKGYQLALNLVADYRDRT